MAQQDTPAAGSGKTPAATSAKSLRTRHIFPILYLEALASLAVMHKLHVAGIRRARYQKTAYTHAIWRACSALQDDASKHLKNAREDGMLLFCWDGSKVVNLSR